MAKTVREILSAMCDTAAGQFGRKFVVARERDLIVDQALTSISQLVLEQVGEDETDITTHTDGNCYACIRNNLRAEIRTRLKEIMK
jgi:hypothetical protein